jgi:hypothetical protein
VSSPVGQFQGILDIDGDGYPDSVSLSEAAHWKVFRNEGGAGAPFNGQLLCRECNLKKSNKVWEKIKEVAKKIQDM